MDIPSFFPDLKYCGDNAAMIAALGWYEFTGAGRQGGDPVDSAWDAYASYDFAKHFRGTSG
jgi:tRNA A37 threonylcarbamoyltransferase TsaD